MQLHNLKPAKGATHSRKRVGRGEGSGLGVTAGKGNKGQQSRSGYKTNRGFEGGQNPLHRRIPKRGFKSPNRVAYKTYNLAQVEEILSKYDFDAFTLENLYVHGLVSRTDVVKVLGNGELKTKTNFKINAISEKAKQAVEALGCEVEII